MNFWAGFAELLEGASVPLAISIIASLVRVLRTGYKGLRLAVANLATSIFTGQIVWWGLDYYPDTPVTVKAAATGAVAYTSIWILSAVISRMRKVILNGSLCRKGGDR